MTPDELLNLGLTTDVETAGSAFGLGRACSYRLAQSGQFPVKIVRLGHRYKVITSDLLRVLGVDPAAVEGTGARSRNDHDDVG